MRRNFILGGVSLVGFLWVSGWAIAQGGKGPEPQGPRAPQQDQRRMGPRMPHGAGPHRHGPGFMQRLRDLPPEEQERVLANDARFQRLLPEQQERIRENLRRWNALSPQQKQRIRERQEIFQSLSPAQRQEARALFPEWRRLPPERRQALMQTFRHLRGLPPEQRREFLYSPEVQNRLSPEERRLLEGLNQLLPGPGPRFPRGF